MAKLSGQSVLDKGAMYELIKVALGEAEPDLAIVNGTTTLTAENSGTTYSVDTTSGAVILPVTVQLIVKVILSPGSTSAWPLFSIFIS